ncbi:MAG: YraN family protein [Ruminococcaceae bacterium]|nr:YraN family protein [Oscillospiraceae bacterium]
MTTRKLTGRWGEELAAEYLRRSGYKIVALGYRTRMGEIDIIAEKRKFLVFVEVKLRKTDKFGTAGEYVNAEKQRKLRLTALAWMQSNETSKQPRFDVIEIYAPHGIQTVDPTINHIENAF